MKKTLLLICASYFLIVFQASFLAHFGILGHLPWLTIILVIAVNLFEKTTDNSGLWLAAVSGFLLDAFSTMTFGFFTIILTATSIIIKFVIKKYFHLDALKLKKT